MTMCTHMFFSLCPSPLFVIITFGHLNGLTIRANLCHKSRGIESGSNELAFWFPVSNCCCPSNPCDLEPLFPSQQSPLHPPLPLDSRIEQSGRRRRSKDGPSIHYPQRLGCRSVGRSTNERVNMDICSRSCRTNSLFSAPRNSCPVNRPLIVPTRRANGGERQSPCL